MKTMKHKYNTTLILSVFPPSPLSNTMSNTANNYTLNACETQKKIWKVKKKFQFPMNYVRPPSMYRPRKEMKARNNMRKCVQRTQPQILRRIQNKKQKIQSTANVQNDGHKIPGKKIFREQFQKKISLQRWKKNTAKTAETKIVELFTVSIKILITSCALQ